MAKLQAKELATRLRHLEKTAKVLGPIKLVITKIPKRRGIDAVQVANRMKESDKKMVVAIVEVSDRVQIAVAAGDEAVRAGINAGEIVSNAARKVGGGGGGRQFFATGGGPAKDKADDALRIIEETIERQLSTPTAKEVA
jgi:alanyl-tRNA synthetase